MNDVKRVTTPHTASMLLRPFANASKNLNLAHKRSIRVGARASVYWKSVFEATLVVSALVICSFALLDRGIALQRGNMPEWLGPFAQFITRFGKADWILYPTGVVLIALLFINTRAFPKTGLFRLYRLNLWLSFVFLGVGFPYLVSTLLKLAIGRPRPSQFPENGLVGFHPFAFDAAFASFPSGHATIIGAFAIVMSLLLPKWRALFCIVAVLIGFSRVAVGAHHPSDVIAGLAIGGVLAFLVAKWFAARGLLFLSSRRNWPELRPSLRPFSRVK
jgi:membrane-associated phospholipid phosphatase